LWETIWRTDLFNAMRDLDFVGGADVQALVERLYRSSPKVIERAQAIVAAN